MSNIVCCIIFGFFIILGIVDAIQFLIFNMFKLPKHINEKTSDDKTEILLENNPENTEYTIRNMLIQKTWRKNSDIIEINCPNIPVSSDMYKILNMINKDYPYLRIKKSHLCNQNRESDVNSAAL